MANTPARSRVAATAHVDLATDAADKNEFHDGLLTFATCVLEKCGCWDDRRLYPSILSSGWQRLRRLFLSVRHGGNLSGNILPLSRRH